MDVVEQGLRLAKTTLGLVPVSVPGLGPAVELALGIVKLIQETKHAQEECSALALRAANFSLGIYEQLKKRGPDVDLTSTAEHLAVLLCTLEGIEALMKRQAKMNGLKMFFKRDQLKDQAEKLNKQLDDALKLFDVQNDIAVSQDLAVIATTQARIVQHTENSERVSQTLLKAVGDMGDELAALTRSISVTTIARDEDGTMVLRKTDVTLMAELDVSADNLMLPEDQQVRQFKARVKTTGQLLIVKFPKKDLLQSAIQRRKEIVQRSRDIIPNPHVVDLVGYSVPELQCGFLAISGEDEHIPFEAFFRTLHGVDKYVRTLEVAKQIQSAFMYLARDVGVFEETGPELGRRDGTFGSRDLYFTPEGTIRWDAEVWTDSALPDLLQMAEGFVEFGPEHHQMIKALDVARLRQRLNSPSSVERAAAMFVLWDKLMEFADFNRDEECHYAVVEEFPWIGECVRVLMYQETYTPEGDLVRRRDTRPVECEIGYTRTYMIDFDEDRPEEEYMEVIDEYSLYDGLEEDRVQDEPTPQSVMTQDGHWKRYTVLSMDYGFGFRAIQKVVAVDKCRDFFMTQAIDIDVPRHMTDVEEDNESIGPISIVDALHFVTTSHLVSLGPEPIGSPPPVLYFYQLLQTKGWNECEFEAPPWGYWSTSPEPVPWEEWATYLTGELRVNRAFTAKYGVDVQYLGLSDKFKFAWMQTLEGFVFRIETMVVLQSVRLTEDERYMLKEVHTCLTEAYERNREMAPEEVRTTVRRKRVRIEEEDDPTGQELSWHAKRQRRLK